MPGLAILLLFILPYNALGESTDYPDYIGDVKDDQSSESKFFLKPQSQSNMRPYYDLPSTDNYYRPYPPVDKRKCPLCDHSVYPYCSEKLLHDACCCTNPYVQELPYQCKLADCRFLHANSCREHRLIADCCCTDDYRSLLKSFADTIISSELSDKKQEKLNVNI